MAAPFQLPDPAPVDDLPDSAEALEALRQADRAQLAEALEQQIEQRVEQRLAAEIDRRVATDVAHQVKEILEQQTLLRQRLFGRSSEAHAGQGQLFNEAERDASSAFEDDVIESVDTPEASSDPKNQPARRRGKRKPLPPELPRIEHVVDVSEHERQCDCGTPRVRIGEEVSEQLDIVPMKVRVIRTVRPRYGCPNGEHAPVTPANPPRVLPRSNFSAGMLAMVLTTKYADGLPLNRFAKVLGRHGLTVPRQSLARAVIDTRTVLQSLFNLARDVLLDAPVVYMDETPVQVLKAPGKSPGAISYMWVQRGGPPKQPVILFD